MTIDTETLGSPGWWLQVLSRKLHERNEGRAWGTAVAFGGSALREREVRPGLFLLRDWYRGNPPLPEPAEGWRKGFTEFLRLARMNYAELVVEPTRFRMRPRGWRTAVAGDDTGDAQALRIARANDLAVAFGDVAKDMLSLADAYMIVGEPQEATGIPLITAESPLTTITAHDRATGKTLAALKEQMDEWTGEFSSYVFTPGRVDVARRATKAGFTGSVYGPDWDWDEAASGALPAAFADVVPVFRFRNRDGVGDFEPHLDVLARINNGLLDRVVVSKLQAFRQRAIKNLPETSDGQEPRPDGSNVVDYSGAFEADPGTLWQVPDGVDFWESQAIDLGPLRMAVKDDVEGLAAVTSTPLHLITPDAASGSAEGASLLREGHIYKVIDRRDRASGPLARVMACAFAFMGDQDRADVTQIETLWDPAERFSLAEKGSAAAQLNGILPDEELFTEVLQYPPDAIPRLLSMKRAQAATALLFAPPAPAASAAAATPAAITATATPAPVSTDQGAAPTPSGT
ncbi:hypothetical protein [Enterococcus hirae]|uniref:hypothetical protein n=1 Tax=Enterococcus hirae TaxID=1354 RepID=UPI001369CD0A|nr:hypothetical protein [Enterococcus hirae]NAE18045.1 hypothetical protein [Enterococcus hirae]